MTCSIEPASNYPRGSVEWATCLLLTAAHDLAAARADALELLRRTRGGELVAPPPFAFDTTLGTTRLTVTYSGGLYRAELLESSAGEQASTVAWDSAATEAVIELAERLDLDEGTSRD